MKLYIKICYIPFVSQNHTPIIRISFEVQYQTPSGQENERSRIQSLMGLDFFTLNIVCASLPYAFHFIGFHHSFPSSHALIGIFIVSCPAKKKHLGHFQIFQIFVWNFKSLLKKNNKKRWGKKLWFWKFWLAFNLGVIWWSSTTKQFFFVM